MKRFIVAAVVIASATTFVSESPARADGEQCVLTSPSRLAITSPNTQFLVSATGACVGAPGGNAWGGWSLTSPTQGVQDVEQFSDAAPSAVVNYDSWRAAGTMTWLPDGAYDDSANQLTQNAPTLTLKYGSLVYLTSARSGSRLTLTAKAYRYGNGYQSGYVPWTGAVASLQIYLGGWVTLKHLTIPSSGRVNVLINNAHARSYRLVAAQSSQVWGRVSAITHR